MSVENPSFSSEEVAPVVAEVTPTLDPFEAALAVNAPVESSSDSAADSVEAVAATDVTSADASVDSDNAEESEEEKTLREFREALSTAAGDWYVVHSYAAH